MESCTAFLCPLGPCVFSHVDGVLYCLLVSSRALCVLSRWWSPVLPSCVLSGPVCSLTLMESYTAFLCPLGPCVFSHVDGVLYCLLVSSRALCVLSRWWSPVLPSCVLSGPVCSLTLMESCTAFLCPLGPCVFSHVDGVLYCLLVSSRALCVLSR